MPMVMAPIGLPEAGSTTVALTCDWNALLDSSNSTSSMNTASGPTEYVFCHFASR